MAEQATSRELSAREAVEAIRGPMTNSQIMARFKINVAGYADLLKQLYEKRLISEEDIRRRGIRFKVLRRAAEPETPPEKVAVVPSPPQPPPLMDNEEEFLDTVTLTELLTFKPPEPPRVRESETSKGPAPEEPETESEKKSKFSITGLFKKS